MQTAVGLKYVNLRVLRAGLKFAFVGWRDVCREAVLDQLVGTHKCLSDDCFVFVAYRVR